MTAAIGGWVEDGWMIGWMGRLVLVGWITRWMDGQITRSTDGWMVGWTVEQNTGYSDGWEARLLDEEVDGQITTGWMDGWMDTVSFKIESSH